MKLALMQPYFMPYIGYFQLVKSVDKFVFYDDVNYIKQGWINRNNILLQGKASLFTIPLANASSFSKINEVQLHTALVENWKVKFLRSIEQNYKKAPHFLEVFALISNVLATNTDRVNVLAKESIMQVANYLQLNTQFEYSSTVYNNADLSGKTRVLSICKQENADVYINSIGGQELYNKDEFAQNNIDLYFIQSQKHVYQQFKGDFVPWLSIIDVLMFNSIEEVNQMLDQYSLV